MPSQLKEYLGFLESFKYIDFQALLASLNSPLIYGTLIVGGIVLFFAFAQYRRHLFHTSISGAGLGFMVGILLTLVIEGFLIYKYFGLSFFLALLQRKPTEISQAQIGPVLGDSSCTSPENIEGFFKALSVEKARALKLSLCQEVLKEIR